MKKILVVTPRFPFDLHGACEQDRAHGIVLLKKLGYDVEVICMCYKRHAAMADAASVEYRVPIFPVLYSHVDQNNFVKWSNILKRILNPRYWDGASYEYMQKPIQDMVSERIKLFNPDIVWFEYSYLWPLHHRAKKSGKLIVTRSLNYEPGHYYDASRKNIISKFKYGIKKHGELRMLRSSQIVFAITPRESALYKKLAPETSIHTLPLRRLGILIGKHPHIQEKKKLNIYFAGSNFSVHHMYEALLFVLTQVNPLLQKKYPNIFSLHIIGGKMPDALKDFSADNVTFHGYVPDLETFLDTMDIALSPSLSGQGMQQKVFEPIVRGIPTVTSPRVLAGYPFKDGEHIMLADTATEYVAKIGDLIPVEKRQLLSRNAVSLSTEIFREESMMQVIQSAINTLP